MHQRVKSEKLYLASFRPNYQPITCGTTCFGQNQPPGSYASASEDDFGGLFSFSPSQLHDLARKNRISGSVVGDFLSQFPSRHATCTILTKKMALVVALTSFSQKRSFSLSCLHDFARKNRTSGSVEGDFLSQFPSRHATCTILTKKMSLVVALTPFLQKRSFSLSRLHDLDGNR